MAAFLGLEAQSEAIESAAQAASFEVARGAEDAAVAKGDLTYRREVAALQRNDAQASPDELIAPVNDAARIFRKGLVGEWREVLRFEDLAPFYDRARALLHQFGYRSTVPQLPPCDDILVGLPPSVARRALELAGAGRRVGVLDDTLVSPLDAASGVFATDQIGSPRALALMAKAGCGWMLHAASDPLAPMHFDALSGRVFVGSENVEVFRAVDVACRALQLPLERLPATH